MRIFSILWLWCNFSSTASSRSVLKPKNLCDGRRGFESHCCCVCCYFKALSDLGLSRPPEGHEFLQSHGHQIQPVQCHWHTWAFDWLTFYPKLTVPAYLPDFIHTITSTLKEYSTIRSLWQTNQSGQNNCHSVGYGNSNPNLSHFISSKNINAHPGPLELR